MANMTQEKMAEELTVPTLHLNGSGWKNLYEQCTASLGALRAAKVALPQPNARDYYVQGDYAILRATSQLDAQFAKLDEVEAELTKILEAISEQNDKRGGR